jgi:Na+-driven multidrug efflux pump
MFLNVSRVFLYRVPTLWILQHFTTMGAEAVGVTMMVSNVGTGLTAIVLAIPLVRHIRTLCAAETPDSGQPESEWAEVPVPAAEEQSA